MILAVAIFLGFLLVGGAIILTRYPLQQAAFFAVGLLVLTISWNGVRIGGGAFGDGFLALAVIAVLAHVIVDRRRIIVPPWLLAAAAVMVLAALVCAIFPPSLAIQNLTELQFNQQFSIVGVPITAIVKSRSNVSALLKFEISLVVVPIVLSVVATTGWRINRLLDLWTIGATINAFVGIADRAGLHALAPVAINGDRSAGLTVHPNYLALTCILGIPTALRWFGRSDRHTIAALAAAVILIGGEYSTGSRDGNVAAVIGLVLTLAFMPRLRSALRYVIPGVGMFLVIVLAFTNAGHAIINQMRLGGPTVSTTGSNYERSIVAHVAESQIRARPIAGVGFAVDNDAQNIYLQLLAAGGVIATCGFLVFLGGLARCMRRARRSPLSEEASAIGVCVIAWLINGYYDSQIIDKYLYVLPGLLIACAHVAVVRRTPAPAAVAEEVAAQAQLVRVLAPIGGNATSTA